MVPLCKEVGLYDVDTHDPFFGFPSLFVAWYYPNLDVFFALCYLEYSDSSKKILYFGRQDTMSFDWYQRTM
eukprot:5758529-Ditylum_brightwellii.AAC.1